MLEAACKGMAPRRERGEEKPVKDKFFLERGDTALDAQMVCLSCTVRQQCGTYSVRIGADYGVWAGALKKRGKDDSEDD